MMRKILPLILAISVALGVHAAAAEPEENQEGFPPGFAQEMPREGSENRSGDNGGGMPPQGRREERAMPQGAPEMPQRDTALPEGQPQEENHAGQAMPVRPEDNKQSGEVQPGQTAENNSENNQESREQLDEAAAEPENEQRPDGFGEGNEFPNRDRRGEEQQEAGFFGFVKSYATPIFSVFLLAVAFVFVVLYKRREY